MCALVEIVQSVWADLCNNAKARSDNIDDFSAAVVVWSGYRELIGLWIYLKWESPYFLYTFWLRSPIWFAVELLRAAYEWLR